MALGAFILCGYFSIKGVKFTCMVVWPPNKLARMPIIDVLIIDSLHYNFLKNRKHLSMHVLNVL